MEQRGRRVGISEVHVQTSQPVMAGFEEVLSRRFWAYFLDSMKGK